MGSTNNTCHLSPIRRVSSWTISKSFHSWIASEDFLRFVVYSVPACDGDACWWHLVRHARWISSSCTCCRRAPWVYLVACATSYVQHLPFLIPRGCASDRFERLSKDWLESKLPAENATMRAVYRGVWSCAEVNTEFQ